MTTTKICPTCKLEKSINEFIKPLLWRCYECENQSRRDRRRKKREEFLATNPQPIRTSKACTICKEDKPLSEFYFANRAKGILSSYCKKCQVKLGNAQRAVRPHGFVRPKCTRLKTTVEWFFNQLQEQENLCAICRQPEIHPVKVGGKTRMLAIDHDHKTGRLRGLLCFRCNTAIHQFEKHGDDWGERALTYLRKYR
jgi:hypothetical protein